MQYHLCATMAIPAMLQPNRRGTQQRLKPQSGGKMKEPCFVGGLDPAVDYWALLPADYSCLLIPVA